MMTLAGISGATDMATIGGVEPELGVAETLGVTGIRADRPIHAKATKIARASVTPKLATTASAAPRNRGRRPSFGDGSEYAGIAKPGGLESGSVRPVAGIAV